MDKTKKARRELMRDFLMVLIGAILAYILSRLGVIDGILSIIGNDYVASFLSGVFFTSVFTIVPATVAITHIADHNASLVVVLCAALGAVCGDLILFYVIRDRFADDIKNALKPRFVHKVMSSFHLGFLKWLAPLAGAILMTVGPDEPGLALMGLSKTKISILMPISFTVNFIALFSLLWFTNAL